MQADPVAARKAAEDTLHVGATRPARLLGLPMPLAAFLIGLGYEVQTSVTGWHGLLWAVTITGPVWFVSYLAVANDPYGINVFVAWARTCVALRGKASYGGPSLSPLPNRQDRRRGMLRV